MSILRICFTLKRYRPRAFYKRVKCWNQVRRCKTFGASNFNSKVRCSIGCAQLKSYQNISRLRIALDQVRNNGFIHFRYTSMLTKKPVTL